MTYKQAYDKIIEAYFNDELLPMDPNFCFCGTLANNRRTWCTSTKKDTPFYIKKHGYTSSEFTLMEEALLKPLIPFGAERGGNGAGKWTGFLLEFLTAYEDALFAGMCAALDVLKEIHRSRGEDVDGLEVSAFTKRSLVG